MFLRRRIGHRIESQRIPSNRAYKNSAVVWSTTSLWWYGKECLFFSNRTPVNVFPAWKPSLKFKFVIALFSPPDQKSFLCEFSIEKIKSENFTPIASITLFAIYSSKFLCKNKILLKQPFFHRVHINVSTQCGPARRLTQYSTQTVTS